MPDKAIICKDRNGRAYTKTTSGSGGTWRRSSTHTYYPRQEYVDEVIGYIGTAFDGRPFNYTNVIDSGELSISRTTAYKVLITLEEDGRIRKEGKGRSSRYYLVNIDGDTEKVRVTETVTEGNNDNED